MMIGVHINDLRILASQVSKIDMTNGEKKRTGGHDPKVTEICQQSHETIIRMLGADAHLVYGNDDGSEYDPRN